MTEKQEDSFSQPYEYENIIKRDDIDQGTKKYNMLEHYSSVDKLDYLYTTIFIESYFNNPKE